MMIDERENDGDKFTIDRVDMGTGWVLFQGGETPPSPEQLPFYLNDVLCKWLGSHSEFRVRAVLPITVEGNTVAINVWFD